MTIKSFGVAKMWRKLIKLHTRRGRANFIDIGFEDLATNKKIMKLTNMFCIYFVVVLRLNAQSSSTNMPNTLALLHTLGSKYNKIPIVG